MNYTKFEQFVRQQSMHETIYEDSEGRDILVIRMLDALVLYRKAAYEEREACAKLCEELDKADDTVYRELSDGGVCANAIRARK